MLTMRLPRSLRRQRGAALIIGLLMLMVLTILAFTGLNSSITELSMANNEQLRRNASQAAASGIETAIANLPNISTAIGSAPTVVGPILTNDSRGSARADKFTTRTRFAGEERSLPQSSADKFVGLHFVIESEGASARNARDSQLQGVFVVTSAGGAGHTDFGQLGSGLP